MKVKSKELFIFALLLGALSDRALGDAAPAASQTGYTVRWAERYGPDYKKTMGTYATKAANDIPSSLSANDKASMSAAGISEHFSAANFKQDCPGGSFLVGIHSDFTNGDRRFSFQCAFLENDQGNLLIKSNCTGDFKPENEVGKPAESTCTGFVAGIESHKYIDGALQDDRRYQTRCCDLGDSNKKLAKPAADQCKLFSAQAGASFDIMCPDGMIVSHIGTYYSGEVKDRGYNIQCCKGVSQ